MTPISKRKRACFYIYKKQTNRETFIYIYKNPDTLQEARQFGLLISLQKAGHFKLHKCSWIFKIGMYIYTKITTL